MKILKSQNYYSSPGEKQQDLRDWKERKVGWIWEFFISDTLICMWNTWEFCQNIYLDLVDVQCSLPIDLEFTILASFTQKQLLVLSIHWE